MIKILLLLLSLLSSTAYAQSVTTDTLYGNQQVSPVFSLSQENTPVVNNNISILQGDVNGLFASIYNHSPGGILQTQYGGTGLNLSEFPVGDILMGNGNGVGVFQPGATGDVLVSQGLGNYPIWGSSSSPGSLLFEYSGQVDAQGTAVGEYVGTSLLPTTGQGNYRFLETGANTSYIQIWSSKFTKISAINTVTVWVRIWIASAINGSQAAMLVSIGGQTGSVTGNVNETSPQWESFTIDVSGLTNGSTYDVLASQYGVGGFQSYCSNIIGFGS